MTIYPPVIQSSDRTGSIGQAGSSINSTLQNSRFYPVFSIKPTEKQGGNRDYIIQYRLTGDQIESGLLLYKGKDENFFLAMVQPPKRVVTEQIPPREYVFIVDVSGSMNGFPLNIAG